MTNFEARFEHLAEFLADTEAMPLKIVIAELEAADINVAQFVAEVKAITTESSRTHVALRFDGDISRHSKDELMKLLAELESGPFGAEASSPLPVAARTRDLSRLSDKELRERIETLQNNREGYDNDQPTNKA
jgi:hypothetical protein